MNAQAQMNWKELYGLFTDSLSFKGDNLIREDMYRYRREAALERQVAALQRKTEAQAQRIAELEAESSEAWPNPFLLSGDELDRAERQARSR